MANFVRVGSGFALAMLLIGATEANAALITFNNRTAFNLAAPGLPVEDFEEANVTAGNVATFAGPLNSSSNDGVFSPGEILAGFTMAATPNTTLAALGDGFAGFPTVTVGPNFFSDHTNLLFGNASAVGFDIHTNVTSNFTISMFGVGDVLLGASVINVPSGAAGVFFGVIDTTNLITRINVTSATTSGEVFDNVAFGAAIPEPSTFLLIGGGLLAAIGRRRLQKRS